MADVQGGISPRSNKQYLTSREVHTDPLLHPLSISPTCHALEFSIVFSQKREKHRDEKIVQILISTFQRKDRMFQLNLECSNTSQVSKAASQSAIWLKRTLGPRHPTSSCWVEHIGTSNWSHRIPLLLPIWADFEKNIDFEWTSLTDIWPLVGNIIYTW